MDSQSLKEVLSRWGCMASMKDEAQQTVTLPSAPTGLHLVRLDGLAPSPPQAYLCTTRIRFAFISRLEKRRITGWRINIFSGQRGWSGMGNLTTLSPIRRCQAFPIFSPNHFLARRTPHSFLYFFPPFAFLLLHISALPYIDPALPLT